MFLKVSFHQQMHLIDIKEFKGLKQLKEKIPKIFSAVPLIFELAISPFDSGCKYDKYLKQENFDELISKQDKNVKKLIIIDMSERIKQEDDILSIKSDSESHIIFEELHNSIDQSQNELALQKRNDEQKQKKDTKTLKNIRQKDQIVQKQIKIPFVNYKLITQRQRKIKNQQILNPDIQCDGCFQFPIIGPIYKCLLCENHDYCNKCEQTHFFHPLLKIKNQNEYPKALTVYYSKQARNEMKKVQNDIQNQKQQVNKFKQMKINDSRVKVHIQNLLYEKIPAKNFLNEIFSMIV